MSCIFEEKCYNYNSDCDECMHNSSGTTLDYFEFNGEGNEPSQEELDAYFETVCSDEAVECSFEDVCYNYNDECERCMYNPCGTTMDYFEFNGEGEEPTQKELDDETY